MFDKNYDFHDEAGIQQKLTVFWWFDHYFSLDLKQLSLETVPLQ